MRFPTMWYLRPAKPQISLHIHGVWSEPLLEYSVTVKLLTKQHLEFLRLKGGFTGSTESTYVKMPQCWKSHVAAHMFLSIDNSVQSVSLAVSVVLSILAVYVLLPFSEAVGTFLHMRKCQYETPTLTNWGSNVLSEPLSVCITHMR